MMSRTAVLELALALLLPTVPSQEAPSDPPFRPGETLSYEVKWDAPGWLFFLPDIHAGEMQLRVAERIPYGGVPAYRLVATARSSGTLPKITGVSVDDYFESTMHPHDFCALRTVKRTREGRRKRDMEVRFHRDRRELHLRELDASANPPRELRNEVLEEVPECVQDTLSVLYAARRFLLEPGRRYSLFLSDNGRTREIFLHVQKRERVGTPAGPYPALKIETRSALGGLFGKGGRLWVWVSDDWRKIPIKFEARVSLGRVYGALSRAEMGGKTAESAH
ncbi:MAG: DUF3108 domain-containing protein [Acidobacteria bacterium]|nr:DUF3108 domain-containing protein [Acidobacteriota bacterium]